MLIIIREALDIFDRQHTFTCPHLIRVNATQATGMDSGVYALAVSGSSLYAGGGFTTYRGTAANKLAKVDLTSGNLDTPFTQATGANSTIYALVVSGSSLYVGGDFTTYREILAPFLTVLDLVSGALAD